MNMSLDYQSFLDGKTQLGQGCGFEPIEVPSFLFPFQKHLLEWALRRGRSGIFADCGLGKTPLQLSWADNVVRYTNKPVLILAPLSVGSQTIREATKFGIEAEQSRYGVFHKKIVITNYEKLSCFKPDDFSGVVCDESSILKNFNGKTKAAVIEFMRTIPYRLLCTATAAPNDYIELGNSAESLGEMGFQDMITRFFKQDLVTKTHQGWGRPKYRMRPHGEHDFWRWVCSWGRACRKPSDIGFTDEMYSLPKLITNEHTVIARTKKSGFLFEMPAVTLKDQREERRRTINERCEMVANLVAHDKPVIVWCHLNDEADLAEKMIRGSVNVSGADSDEKKERAFSQFEYGQIRVLISKPSIAGFGLNWQHCAHQTFFPSHSFEQWYQAVRRSYRFGQKNDVHVDIITTEGESGIMANLQRKQIAAEMMFTKLVQLMNNQMHISTGKPFEKNADIPDWLLQVPNGVV
jgi:hypothetical protein